ncbi:hypothetical protein [Kribbella sp. CA-294648]|uniref:hypothetical protein n=1 Tax=Kribbella sp. CA-294648 TaxID=3239948 RepID=UPI003D8C1EE9
MPEELKDRFQQLVADPPPPSAVPSEAVFAKVRTVRRRRTAGVAVLAAAAVVAITVAGNSLTEINTSPPVSGKPGGGSSIVDLPPTGGITVTVTRSPTTTPPPVPPAIGVAVTLTPTVTGRSLLMEVTLKGTVISPLGIEGDTTAGTELPAGTSFLNRTLGTDYTYGDGEQSGSDGGSVTCTGAKKRVTSQETYTLMDGPHVYQKAGTYTFSYTVMYCGANGKTLRATKSAKIVIR